MALRKTQRNGSNRKSCALKSQQDLSDLDIKKLNTLYECPKSRYSWLPPTPKASTNAELLTSTKPILTFREEEETEEMKLDEVTTAKHHQVNPESDEESCDDHESFCELWRMHCDGGKSQPYMKTNCKKTCNMCPI